ncbi:MAG: twin-arginine translocase subunit TatC [Acidimicrobiales bacterium]
MTLFEHIGELRRRLVFCIIAFVVGGIVSYAIYNQILGFFQGQYRSVALRLHQSPNFYTTNVLQGFSTRLDVSAYGGLVIALPIILYELWKFVTPGMKANERKYALPFVVASLVLFAAGGATAYLIFPKALAFLIQSSGAHVKALFAPNSYITLVAALMLIFGIAFEFPVVLVALELAGVFGSAALKGFRRWAILLITIFSAVITPSSDPFSMLALAIPLVVFYEGSIIVGRLLGK